jgi:hypothetical protein
LEDGDATLGDDEAHKFQEGDKGGRVGHDNGIKGVDLEDSRSDNSESNKQLMQEGEPAPERGRYNLRSNRTCNYDNRLAHQMDNLESSKSYDAQFLQQGNTEVPSLREVVTHMNNSGSNAKVFEYITGFIMTRMTAKAGIKKRGQVAIDALYQEFLWLHDLGVFEGQQARELMKAQKRGALRAISVIKEKQWGRIKDRTVADGRPIYRTYE